MNMKNNRLYPFERNRFFYGKLLTVRDFESEQKYFNDKRRLINRLVFGSGILCGLQVVAIDDKTISVESGVALDSTGREIIVGFPVTQKLSMIEGFTNNDYIKNIYLCIDYDEKGKESVHSVASSSTRPEEISEYNRVQETYRLFVKEEGPDISKIQYNDLFENMAVIYSDSQVLISQSVPRYVNPGDALEVVIKIEKALQVPKIDLDFELELQGAESEGENSCRVTFAEPSKSKETQYEIRQTLIAGKMSDKIGKIIVKNRGSILKIGDNSLNINPDNAVTFEVINQPAKSKILDDYMRQPLDKALAAAPDQSIYLAKISLLQVGPTYIIEKVQQSPFNQYVYNESLIQKLVLRDLAAGQGAGACLLSVKGSVESLEPGEKANVRIDYNANKEMDFRFRLPSPRILFGDVTTGTVDIELGPKGAKAGTCFYSEEISHDLGLGSVFLGMGVEESSNSVYTPSDREEDKILFGAYDIFNDSPFKPFSPVVSLGAMVYPKKGTFEIGVKLKNSTKQNIIRIRWWAYKKQSDSDRTGRINVVIEPETSKVKRGESIRLSAEVTGTTFKQVTWEITEKSGGTIDNEGLYTAPDKPGVFEIQAVSSYDPTKSATTYVVVE
jgi:hypothetical protein